MSFFVKYLLPELVTRALDCDSHPPSGEDDGRLYCVCQQPESGRMIACENHTCPTEWFHFECVRLKRAPCDKWFCIDCKK